MVGDAAKKIRVTYEQYLAIERESDRKYEWVAGEIYAMAGGTPAHARISAAVIRELGNAALQCGCAVFTSDAKIYVPTADLATYPDVSVVCDPPRFDERDTNAIVNPAVLVEVLSESTEAWDRGRKFTAYQQIETLQDYVLVSQYEQRIEHFARGEDGTWVLRNAVAGQSVKLRGMPAVIEVDRVYAGIALSERAVRDPQQK